jgi:hypothetical protein
MHVLLALPTAVLMMCEKTNAPTLGSSYNFSNNLSGFIILTQTQGQQVFYSVGVRV